MELWNEAVTGFENQATSAGISDNVPWKNRIALTDDFKRGYD